MTHQQAKAKRRPAVHHVLHSMVFRICLLIATILFTALYVVQVSAVSTRGYDISVLRQEISELEQENRRLEVKIAEHRSISTIQHRLANMEFVSAAQPQYVQINRRVAAKR